MIDDGKVQYANIIKLGLLLCEGSSEVIKVTEVMQSMIYTTCNHPIYKRSSHEYLFLMNKRSSHEY